MRGPVNRPRILVTDWERVNRFEDAGIIGQGRARTERDRTASMISSLCPLESDTG